MPKVGKKRSDRRWISDAGEEFDSKFEWEVTEGLRGSGYRIRRCYQGDTLAYVTPVRAGRCLECSSDSVVQERTYTPDLYVAHDPFEDVGGSYHLELKGKFLQSKRSLFRSVAKQWKGTDLRIVFQSNRRLTGSKLTPVEYIHKFCKDVVPGVWDKKTQRITWYEK